VLRSSTPFHLILPALALAAAALAGCAPSSYGGVSGTTFNLCAPLAVSPDADATADQLDGIGQALALWNQQAGTQLSLAPAGAAAGTPETVPIHFQAAAANFHGLYDGQTAQVFINLNLPGHERVVVIAHELGHAYGLVHVSPDQRASVMNPNNLSVDPTPADAAAMVAIWGTCGP